MERKKLTDILHGSSAQSLTQAWGATQAAEDFGPLPSGDYVCRLAQGELFNSKTKDTPGYRITFRVLEGEFVNRRIWHELWLTQAALPKTKRDFAKFGITSPEQLERPVPLGIRCKVKVTMQRNDDGVEFNKVRSFEVVGIDEIEADPFAPAEGGRS